jgi:nucleoside phosphorylase
MILLTFAHKGEAQEFIKRKHTIAVDFYFEGIYRNDNELLIVTKEGLQSTTERLASVCTYFGNKIKLVINFGIAGSLSKRLQINQIYGIQKVFLEPLQSAKSPIFTTYEQNSRIDCITAFNPVLDDSYAYNLAKIAQVVDRELWACASVCALFRLPLKSYKLISDKAGSKTASEQIRNRTSQYSKHLFDFYKKLDLSNMLASR